MQLTAQFSSLQERTSIDRASRLIAGVSVITVGEADGHSLFIDDTTLKQVAETASAYKGGLKVKFNHGGGLESIVGTLQNFKVEGGKVRADLHILENAEDGDKVFELAEKIPDSFGLSISFSNHPEEVDGKKFARCAEIYSADLVDSPAANPSGLFSKQNDKPETTIMSKAFALALSLPETATEEEIAAALTKRLEASQPTDLTKVTADIEAAKTELSKLTTAAAAATEQAKKTEITALVAEASRDGKVVPLTDEQLSKMDVADIKEMISKLPAQQVSLKKKATSAVPTKDGKIIQRGTPEAMEFCREKRAEGAEQLTALIRGQSDNN